MFSWEEKLGPKLSGLALRYFASYTTATIHQAACMWASTMLEKARGHRAFDFLGDVLCWQTNFSRLLRLFIASESGFSGQPMSMSRFRLVIVSFFAGAGL
jgi:hypothetical protein